MRSINALLTKKTLTDAEKEAIVRSADLKPSREHHIDIEGKKFRFLYISDTHIGHKKFDESLFERAVVAAKTQHVDFILHPGDHVEEMSGRPGHVYELHKVGFNDQVNYTRDLYAQFDKKPIYAIDGNHDFWYVQKNDAGCYVGRTLEQRLPAYKHLGEWEGDLVINGGLKIKLFHANDGTAYATSYKLQKLIESFTGGEKPHIVLSGHYHKAMYMFNRNVHGFECGTICGQSGFMRGKKIPAHKGFGVVDVTMSGSRHKSVDSLTHTFYPGYD